MYNERRSPANALEHHSSRQGVVRGRRVPYQCVAGRRGTGAEVGKAALGGSSSELDGSSATVGAGGVVRAARPFLVGRLLDVSLGTCVAGISLGCVRTDVTESADGAADNRACAPTDFSSLTGA